MQIEIYFNAIKRIFFITKCKSQLLVFPRIRTAAFSAMSGIVKNLKDFAKKSGKC